MDPTATLSPERLLRRLEWRVVRRLDGLLQGDYRSLFRGMGLDFTDLREYEPGDDLRHIEWNVTARLDTPYVREYVEDREITTWLLLDVSPSMAFGPVARQKGLIVAEVATTIAHVLSRGGSRVGAVLFDIGVRTVIPPASGRNQVLRIAKAALDHREEGAGTGSATDAGTGSVTDLGALFRATAGLARRRSLVIVVSDFISAEGWERPLALLARRHEVVGLQVSDPRESELPDVGSIYVEDAETGEQIFVDTSDAGFRQRLREAAADRQEALEGEAHRAGADLHRVSTDDDLVRVLVRVAGLRRRRRR
ncbi:MAG TPA: DUF58 domain-containing protein [Intrasporangium sp.]|uniref:DUF58 domain-containing protein n=1 Tax=Intrasporangium sp. TaxID=1925024 RepID=UPI002B496D2C|nr:DUF58 domain-containing protein [Intrasporangium sp.]HKX66338.1 DUF58 domain-containing protein [Intrasporangium sp.]